MGVVVEYIPASRGDTDTPLFLTINCQSRSSENLLLRLTSSTLMLVIRLRLRYPR